MAEKGYFANGEAQAPEAETVPEPDDDKAVVSEDFCCCWPAHDSASCPGGHFVEVLGAAPPTDTQCNYAALKVFLGCWLLRRHAFR
jgi:hypothetical protein